MKIFFNFVDVKQIFLKRVKPIEILYDAVKDLIKSESTLKKVTPIYYSLENGKIINPSSIFLHLNITENAVINVHSMAKKTSCYLEEEIKDEKLINEVTKARKENEEVKEEKKENVHKLSTDTQKKLIEDFFKNKITVNKKLQEIKSIQKDKFLLKVNKNTNFNVFNKETIPNKINVEKEKGKNHFNFNIDKQNMAKSRNETIEKKIKEKINYSRNSKKSYNIIPPQRNSIKDEKDTDMNDSVDYSYLSNYSGTSETQPFYEYVKKRRNKKKHDDELSKLLDNSKFLAINKEERTYKYKNVVEEEPNLIIIAVNVVDQPKKKLSVWESEKSNINKEIYFLCDKYNRPGNNKYSYDEINKNNCEVYIDDFRVDFCKKTKFTSTGKHIITLKIDGKIKSCERMFYGCFFINEIDLRGFQSSEVTNMSNMFCDCYNLERLNLDGLNTSSVTDMSYMFSGCNNLLKINIESFNTGKVTDMRNMFESCYFIETLNLKNFNTENVNNMRFMFSNCRLIKDLDLSGFNTSNVTDFTDMFSHCEKINSMSIVNFITKNAKSLSGMFKGCYELTVLNLKSFETNNVTNMSHMFYKCYRIQDIFLEKFDTSNVEDFSFMFSSCSKIKKLKIDNFDISKAKSIKSMFSSCPCLEEINLSKFDTSNVTDFSRLFDGCSELKSLNLKNFNFKKAKNISHMFSNCRELIDVEFDGTKINCNKISTANDVFSNCINLKNIKKLKNILKL